MSPEIKSADEALAVPLRIGTRAAPMSASIGISMYPDNATDIDTLIQQADAAMYQAKRAGRSTYRFFSADMNRLAVPMMMKINPVTANNTPPMRRMLRIRPCFSN